jgi:predicted HicB family RNase H-like nuclease
MVVVPRGLPRESLNLRVPPELKRQIEEYSAEVGISINAACIVILTEGLRAERLRQR